MHYLPNRAAAFLAIIAVFFVSTVVRAATYYVTQSGAGSADGSSLVNAASVATLNSHTNSPGDTIIINGLITTAITVSNSGSVGNPITYLWATGAKMSSPAWATNAITDSTQSYLVFDGGSNGIIENTDNGSSLGHQVADGGISMTNVHDITIKNLTIQNIYVRSSTSDESSAASGNAGIYFTETSGTAANILVTNCTIHDADIGCGAGYTPGATNYEFSYNNIYNCNWDCQIGNPTSSSAITGVLVHHNHFHNWSNWDDPGANIFHHNGFFGFVVNGGGTMTNVSVYDNTIGSGFGTFQTAGVYISSDSGGTINNVLIYNNLFDGSDGTSAADAFVFIWPNPGTLGNGYKVYSNTFLGKNSGNAIGFYQGSGPGNTTFEAKDNLILNCSFGVLVYYNADSTLISDYNLFYNSTTGVLCNSSPNSSAGGSTFSQWQGLGYDTHSTTGNPNLNSSYIPQAPSAAIGSGTNLSSFFTTDMAGNSRPASPAAWDIGAYQYVSASPLSPVITTQPASQTVAAGSNVTFAVTASGMPTPTYQWQKDGANISGATGAALTLSSVTTADAATYSAVATNSAGSATSNGAMLTVTSTSVAPFITAQPSGQTVTTGASVTFVVAASGTPTPTLQWQKNGSAVSGSTDTTFTLNGVTSADSATYTAVATNSAGSATSNGAVLTVTSAPVITTQPASQTVTAGSNVTFTVAASGKPTPTYQWKENGIAISGSTGTTFTLNGVTSANSATYTAVVTNSAGSATSNGAVLTVASSWKIRHHH
jgi:hypothetical protein